MDPGSVRTFSYLLLMIQYSLFIHPFALPYSLYVAAELVHTPTLARREDDLANFGQTVPILGQVSSDLLITVLCFVATTSSLPAATNRNKDGTHGSRLQRRPSPRSLLTAQSHPRSAEECLPTAREIRKS
jgi:hypothetical protein